MFALTRLRLPIAVLIAVVFAALLAFAAFSSTAEANHSWGGYHWARTSNPFKLLLGDNVSSAWDSYLREAAGYNNSSRQNNTFNDWSDSAVLETPVVSGQSTGNCRPTAGRVEVCNKAYGQNGWLGIAGISVSGKHITQGYTKMNDTYFSTAKYNTPAWRRLVMCQEVGHTFGLDHQDETFDNVNLGTCMDYTNDPDGGAGGASSNDPRNERPNSHDYTQLASIYSHLDSITTVGTAGQTSAANKPPAAAADEADRDNEGPGQWGRLVRQSADGRLALYEKDLGGGHRQFRFVIWADGAPQTNGKGRQDDHTHDEAASDEAASDESASDESAKK
jgi:hypothetical protein